MPRRSLTEASPTVNDTRRSDIIAGSRTNMAKSKKDKEKQEDWDELTIFSDLSALFASTLELG
jgi:hypothetical protein